MDKLNLNDENIQIQFLKQMGVFGETENLFFLAMMPSSVVDPFNIYGTQWSIYDNPRIYVDMMLVNKSERGIGIIPFCQGKVLAQMVILVPNQAIKEIFLVNNKEQSLRDKISGMALGKNLIIREEEGRAIEMIYDENNMKMREFFEKYKEVYPKKEFARGEMHMKNYFVLPSEMKIPENMKQLRVEIVDDREAAHSVRERYKEMIVRMLERGEMKICVWATTIPDERKTIKLTMNAIWNGFTDALLEVERKGIGGTLEVFYIVENEEMRELYRKKQGEEL